jgi:hypothetical protein
VVVHVDRLGRIDELEAVGRKRRRAEQDGLDVRRSSRYRAGDDLVGRAIAPERIDGNAHAALVGTRFRRAKPGFAGA